MSSRPTIGVVFGTRPEAIKLAPVIHQLKQRSGDFRLLSISTAQHRTMLDQVLDIFQIRPDEVDAHLRRIGDEGPCGELETRGAPT